MTNRWPTRRRRGESTGSSNCVANGSANGYHDRDVPDQKAEVQASNVEQANSGTATPAAEGEEEQDDPHRVLTKKEKEKLKKEREKAKKKEQAEAKKAASGPTPALEETKQHIKEETAEQQQAPTAQQAIEDDDEQDEGEGEGAVAADKKKSEFYQAADHKCNR